MEQPLNYEEQASNAAERQTKIDTEASTSKYIQLRPPTVISAGGNELVTYDAHPKIADSDTEDESLMTSRVFANVASSIFEFSRDVSGNLSFESSSESFNVEEPLLTSSNGEYGKVHVKEDRGGNVLLFDFTEDNKRIFLKHSAGTYWNIGDDGSSTFKSVGPSISIFSHDKSELISHNEFKKINTDRVIEVVGSNSETYGSRYTNINGNSMMVCTGGGLQSYGSQRVTYVGGTDYSNVKGAKIYDVGGTFVINAKDTIILRSPNVSIETGSITQKTSAPLREETNGERKISADIVNIIGSNHTSINGGGISFNHSGLFRHVIGGVSIPPDTTASKIEVTAGHYEIETKFGRIDIQSLVLGMKFTTLIAGLEISELGEIDLANKIAGLNISAIGEVEMKSAMGTVKSAMSSLLIDHNVRIALGSSSAKEPLVLGIQLMKWLNSHTHGTGTGPSTTPITPATPADFNSTKVFGS